MYHVVPWSVADEEPGNSYSVELPLRVLNILVTPNKLLDTEGRIVANSCSKLDKVVEARINGGMVPSDRASPDTTISILSGELVYVHIIHVIERNLRIVQHY